MATFVCGDVHGCLDQLQRLVQNEALLDEEGRWCGGESGLWFMGDYLDRGPDGVGVLDLVMRLEQESQLSGGFVGALLGNHDLIALNAVQFGPLGAPGYERQGQSLSFREVWLRQAGGQPQDASRLRPHHLAWLAQRPALVAVGDALLMHADSCFYLDYGSSVDEINAKIAAVIASADAEQRDQLEERFARRREFLEQSAGEDVALENIAHMLSVAGARRLIHGHTPIYKLLEQPAEHIHDAWRYQGGRCVNVDHGLYAGGQGFLFRLD